jgi:hypothetical protein
MTQLAALAYFSSATREFTEMELEALLKDAREQNTRGELTGVLLYHEGTFFQYIEGPQSSLEAAYQRIKNSRKHHSIIELFQHSISRREFTGWRMGFSRAPRSLILQLSNIEWNTLASSGTDSIHGAPGMALLLEFWKSSTR